MTIYGYFLLGFMQNSTINGIHLNGGKCYASVMHPINQEKVGILCIVVNITFSYSKQGLNIQRAYPVLNISSTKSKFYLPLLLNNKRISVVFNKSKPTQNRFIESIYKCKYKLFACVRNQSRNLRSFFATPFKMNAIFILCISYY